MERINARAEWKDKIKSFTGDTFWRFVNRYGCFAYLVWRGN